MFAAVVGVLEKWAQHRTTDDADDNVAEWGSGAIRLLATIDTRPLWLVAEGVLRGIAAGTSAASYWARKNAREALTKLGM